MTNVTDASPLTAYFLPADKLAATASLAALIASAAELWFSVYEFCDAPTTTNLKAARAKGIPVHIYADASMSKRPTQHQTLVGLVAAGCEVTIGGSVAGANFINHTKSIVARLPHSSPQALPSCWEGSFNFDAMAYMEENTILLFASKLWADAFVANFNACVTNAWAKQKSLQIALAQPQPSVLP
jgi:hypothetical protein